MHPPTFLRALLAGSALLLLALPASAIPVTNAGFEDPELSDGGFTQTT